mmetsp:Transcript_87632/g.141917  ORF Transcript_87632/g.141917 Transcript_87632/m.141917 type:complete len:121 (-) Transcript_87632:690-1052(-)
MHSLHGEGARTSAPLLPPNHIPALTRMHARARAHTHTHSHTPTPTPTPTITTNTQLQIQMHTHNRARSHFYSRSPTLTYSVARLADICKDLTLSIMFLHCPQQSPPAYALSSTDNYVCIA